MPEEEITLTPIEQSRVDTGFRFFHIKKGIYNGLTTSLNAKHKFPKGAGTKAVTLRDLVPLEEAQLSAEGTHVLLTYRNSRLTDDEFDDLFNSKNPNVEELVKADWEALWPDIEGVEDN